MMMTKVLEQEDSKAEVTNWNTMVQCNRSRDFSRTDGNWGLVSLESCAYQKLLLIG
jgi:hypothetical protein